LAQVSPECNFIPELCFLFQPLLYLATIYAEFSRGGSLILLHFLVAMKSIENVELEAQGKGSPASKIAG
jgi:hypothetical protein